MEPAELERVRRALGRAWRYAESWRGPDGPTDFREGWGLPRWMFARLLPGRCVGNRLSPRTLGLYLAGDRDIPDRVAERARYWMRRVRAGSLPPFPKGWKRRRRIAYRRRMAARRYREAKAAAEAHGEAFVPLPRAARAHDESEGSSHAA